METPQTETKSNETGLERYLSPVAAWALSFGCAVGWGAFVMPGTTFLPIAGPIGTTIGMLIGTLVMLVIGWNYIAMIKRYPDAGGAFSYAKNLFGYDHGFFSAWFLTLTYIAILWANATALSLIARRLIGNGLQFGFHYVFAGYDVWFGEILFSDFAIVLFGFLIIGGKRLAAHTQTVFAFLLLGGILIVFGAALGTHPHILSAFVPPFSANQPVPLQIFHVAALAPWAFIGFESVSHSATGVAFPMRKMVPVMVLSVAATFFAYVLPTLLAVTELPTGFLTWHHYIAALQNGLDGLAGMPTFYAARAAMGDTGVVILGLAVLGGVVTGIIGMYIAASRILYAMAEDAILPRWFAVLTEDRTPKNSILFIMIISLVIPFFGRTATGWIVDVTTVGATIAYCYVSAAAYATAKQEGDAFTKTTGFLGMVFSAMFSVFLIAPELWNMNALAAESYIILAFWSILGYVVFHYVFSHDAKRRFGHSTVAWIALLFLILISSTMWIKQATHDMMADVVKSVNEFYTEEMQVMGAKRSRSRRDYEEKHLYEQMDAVRTTLLKNTTVQLLLISFGLAIMFSIYSIMRRREQQADYERVQAEETSKAKTTFLSNMSHDIRTPMNAILGYIELAKRTRAECDACEVCPAGHCDKHVPEKTVDYLNKINVSSKHLLALINDILEMSRIESGKMEMEIAPDDISKTLDEVRDMFATQMEAKNVAFSVDASGVKHRIAHFDKNRLNRVLLNLLSNAYKFTPEGGEITVRLTEEEASSADSIYELRVKDTGIGMSKEFAETVFESFTRERSSTVSGIQGTGLGMAITKNIVDMMGGTIKVETEQGAGTEFIIRLRLRFDEEAEARDQDVSVTEDVSSAAFAGKKLLLVDDLDVNREIAKMLLMGAGFVVDTATNGKEALDKVAASNPGEYSAVLMDIQMPIMNGYEATKAIRALNGEVANVPILAMTASAFSEDVAKAKSNGMDGHIAKPIDIPQMMRTLAEIINK